MKICFLGLQDLPVLAPEFNHHGIGGEQVQHVLLAKALVRRGHDVSMVVFDYGQDDGACWDKVTTYKAYRLDAGIPILRYVHPRWDGLWSALRRADADVYYASCAGMQLGLLALFCKKFGKKYIFRAASDTDCEPDKLLVSYWRDKKLYEYGLRHADCILTQSLQQQHAMLANYGLHSQVAEMMVDPSESESGRDVDVLWVNNLRSLKRPELFLALAQRLPHLKFHMAGGAQPGFDALYQSIEKEASAIPNLTFHGRVPYQQIGNQYLRARVFVNTSDIEGFPNSYLQAWVRGTPVVSFFDPDGIIRREKLGASVTSMNDMAGAVDALLKNHAAWTDTSQRCKDYMSHIYGEERILAPYLEVLQQAA
ncbi:hypothetical protein BH11PSE12_BH11PSE12_33550 [soil metagenome]